MSNKIYSRVSPIEHVVEPVVPNTAIRSVIAYIAADLAVTAVCSFSLTPLLVSYGIGNVPIVLILTFISFAVFGLCYWLFKSIFLKEHEKRQEEYMELAPRAI